MSEQSTGDPDVVMLRRARDYPPCPACGKDEYWTPRGTMLVCLGCVIHQPIPRYMRDDSGRNMLTPEQAQAKRAALVMLPSEV